MRLALILFFELTIFQLFAANVYVRDGASGSADGSDWTNAYDDLPATLNRGDTYYIADGSYSAYTFNDATSGTTLITIKKATAGDHGTETGWDSAYGDGTATFGAWTITTDYWLIDGQTRAADWISGYGFKVDIPSATKNLNISGDNITVRYVELEGTGPDDVGSPSNDGIYALSNQTALTFQYMYVHDMGRTLFLGRGLDNMVMEYCFMARNEDHESQHSEAVSLFGGDGNNDNNIFRYNIWEDIEGTGVIVVGDGTGNEFYGNVIYWTSSYPNSGQRGGHTGNGTITSWSSETHSNSKYYNNTVILPASGGTNFRIGNLGAGTGNVAINNIVYCSSSFGSRFSAGTGTTYSYNAYSEDVSSTLDPNGQEDLIDIFTDSSTYDFSLSSATDAGDATLGANYDEDLTGATRGDDGTWDIGAYEFDAGGESPGSAYTGQVRLSGSGATPSLSGGARFKLDSL